MGRDKNKNAKEDLEIKGRSASKAQAHILMEPGTQHHLAGHIPEEETKQKGALSKEKVPSCLEFKPCMGNNKDLTNINVVINSEVAKDIIEKDHVKEKVTSCGDLQQCMVSNKDLTNRNKIVNPEADKDILENNQKGNNKKADTLDWSSFIIT